MRSHLIFIVWPVSQILDVSCSENNFPTGAFMAWLQAPFWSSAVSCDRHSGLLKPTLCYV